MRSVWQVTVAALLAGCSCGAPAGPSAPAAAEVPASEPAAVPGGEAPTLAPAPTDVPAGGTARRVRVRSADGSAFELAAHFGPGTAVALVDVAAEQAPIAPFLPPHPCQAQCGAEPEACGLGQPPVSVAAGQVHDIPWDGTVRRLRHLGAPCYERAPAPPGDYLVQACAVDGRCGLARAELPGSRPIDIVLEARQPERAPSCEPAERVRAVRIALGAARAEGIVPSALEGCPVDVPCGGGELEVAAASCRVSLGTSHDAYVVRVLPAAAEGHPGSVEVWVDRDAVRSGNFFLRGGTWSVSADGEVAVIGLTRHASHTHGGEPAQISSVRLRVANRGDRGRTLSLRGARFRSTFGGSRPVSGAALEAAGPLAVPARSVLEAEVRFDAQPASATSAERFAVEVELELDGEVLHPVADVSVVRREPLRR